MEILYFNLTLKQQMFGSLVADQVMVLNTVQHSVNWSQTPLAKNTKLVNRLLQVFLPWLENGRRKVGMIR